MLLLIWFMPSFSLYTSCGFQKPDSMKIPNNQSGNKNCLVSWMQGKWKNSHVILNTHPNPISYKNRKADKKLSCHWPARGSQGWILTSTTTEKHSKSRLFKISVWKFSILQLTDYRRWFKDHLNNIFTGTQHVWKQ